VPPNDSPFSHLVFQVVHEGRARLRKPPPIPPMREAQNCKNRKKHATYLRGTIDSLRARWVEQDSVRADTNLPCLEPGKQLVLRVEENAKLDFLRSSFDLEIVCEEEDGFVLVASKDTDLKKLILAIQKFEKSQTGGGSAAKLYEIDDLESSESRLKRLLTQYLFGSWPDIQDADTLTVDISIACLGTTRLPEFQPQANDEDEDAYQARLSRHREKYDRAQMDIDDIMYERQEIISKWIATFSNSTVESITQDPLSGIFKLSDSFTIRAKISGACFKDLVLSHPHAFKFEEIDEIEPFSSESHTIDVTKLPSFLPPDENAASVCVIDSGIQERHPFLNHSILHSDSKCFIPGLSPTDTADYVKPSGHGTGVAGCILYPRNMPAVGSKHQALCWIHNARVLDSNNNLPPKLMPALYMQQVVEYFSDTERTHPARIFNHSINTRKSGIQPHMSTCATAIDHLSHNKDILIIQSAGNLLCGTVTKHLASGRGYPKYLLRNNSSIRNPAQSFAAITVGSVAHTYWQNGHRASIAKKDQPSGFSRTGEGMWGCIKPDVVEYGGDFIADMGTPHQVTTSKHTNCSLVCSTMHRAALIGNESVGTSFAAPKVAHLAATLAKQLPGEPCLLYRALIANAARWPDWAEKHADKRTVLRHIGYGIPDVFRAAANNDYRITLISSGAQYIPARDAHIYRIIVPSEINAPEIESQIRIDVTLSYTAQPRITRRRVHGYLSTRLDWKVSKKGESLESFRNRIFYDGDKNLQKGDAIFKWMLRESTSAGDAKGVSRQNSTLQKDWCHLAAHDLPSEFCIAVIGHPGWDASPVTAAKYALVVSFEAVNNDVRIYQPIRVANEVQVPVDVRQRIKVPVEPDFHLSDL